MGIFCELEPVSIGTQSWTMRVKGKDLLRAEVEAVFTKAQVFENREQEMIASRFVVLD